MRIHNLKWSTVFSLVSGGLVAVLVWLLIVYWLLLGSLVGGNGTKTFEIKSGEGILAIAKRLKAEGLIKSEWPLVIYIKAKRLVIQSGIYELNFNQTTKAIADYLASGRIAERQFTIPEGWRVEQIAVLLDTESIVRYEEFMAVAKEQEGYLFPDTYRVGKNWSAKQIVELMKKNFDRRTEELKPTRDDLILASIVEREAKHDVDRAKIAGVYQNRLAREMFLEADPTVQYAIDSKRVSGLGISQLVSYDFWPKVTIEQNKTVESEYNTYRNKGLPPTPIANPGLKSLKAAINPERHNFYYFFNLSDGTTIYSKTIEEHNRLLP